MLTDYNNFFPVALSNKIKKNRVYVHDYNYYYCCSCFARWLCAATDFCGRVRFSLFAAVS